MIKSYYKVNKSDKTIHSEFKEKEGIKNGKLQD